MDNFFFNEKELIEAEEEEEELMVEEEEEEEAEEEEEEDVKKLMNKKENLISSLFSLSLLNQLIDKNNNHSNICICYPSFLFIYCYIYLHSPNKELQKQISSQILQNSKEGEINIEEHDIINEINENQFIFTISSLLSFSLTDTAQSIIEISFMLRNFFFPKVNIKIEEILDKEFNKHNFNDIISMNVNNPASLLPHTSSSFSKISFINEKLHSLSLNADNANDAIEKIKEANLSSFVYLQASFSRKLKTITTKQGITFIRDKVFCFYSLDEKREVVVLDTQSNFELVLIKSKQEEKKNEKIESLVNANNYYKREEINLIVPCFSINVVNDINKITSLVYEFSLEEKDPQFNNIIQVITLELNKYGLNTVKNKRKETNSQNKKMKKRKNSFSSYTNITTPNNISPPPPNIVFTNNFYLFICEKSKRILEKPILSVYIANHSNINFNNYNYYHHQNEDKITNTTYSSFYHSPIMTRNIFNISNFENDFFTQELINNKYINTIKFNYMKIPSINLLCLILEYIPFLSTLILASNDLNVPDLKQIIQALSRNKNISFSLKTLSIIKNNVNDEITEELSKALMNNTVLTHLSLKDNNIISEKGMIYLSNCLKNKQQLNYFNINGNNIGNLGLERLSNVFINLPFLNSLYFNDNNITDTSHFQCPSAHTISLDFNKIQLSGLSKITKEKFPLLSTLKIRFCKISFNNDHDYELKLPNLSKIEMFNNKINNNLLSSLCVSLKDCPLREINLTHNGIIDNDLFNQSDFFSFQKKSLTKLSLANNNISNMENLKDFLVNNTVLTYLNLSNNNINNDQLILLFSYLSSCTLSTLEIDKNPYNNIFFLLESLYYNYSITRLLLNKKTTELFSEINDTIDKFLLINSLIKTNNRNMVQYMNIIPSIKNEIFNIVTLIESIAVSKNLFIPKNIMELIVSSIDFKKIIKNKSFFF